MNNEQPIESFTGPYRFLSNFWLCYIRYEGYVYPSVEHAYQAAKTNDPNAKEFIHLSTTPGRAKYAGRKVVLRSDWENVKQDIMLRLLQIKFSDPVLRGWLLETGDRKLIEGNNWGDTYWGVCKGCGNNFLGKLLMKVREDLTNG